MQHRYDIKGVCNTPLRLILFLLFSLNLVAQSTSDAAVMLEATVQTSPAQITLMWNNFSGATGYTIYRKAKTAIAWGTPVANLSGTATQYTDNTVAVGMGYEYKVVRNGSTFAEGYLYAGIQLPLDDQRGTVIILVDDSQTTALATELERLEQDLIGDGWRVVRHEVSATASVTSVKSLIQADYNANPTAVKAVLLIGHIPVPYAGNLYPDGHSDHQGASDGYYGDLNGTCALQDLLHVLARSAEVARRQRLEDDRRPCRAS